MLTPWKESYDQPRQHIKKQTHCFAHKGPSSQGYGFSSNYVWMWELDYKESWVPKNWCFWTMMLEKTLESPLDCKEIQPIHPKADQSWVSIWRTDVEAETPILWPPDAKSWLIWEDPDAGTDWGEEKKGKQDKMVGCHHWPSGHGFGWTLGVCVGQGGLACCGLWGHKESDTTEWLNWTETIHFSRWSSQPRDGTQVSLLSGRFFTNWATREVIKIFPASTGDLSSIPRLGRSPGEGNCNSLQYSYLGNPIDRRAWQATVHQGFKELRMTEQLHNNKIYILWWLNLL